MTTDITSTEAYRAAVLYEQVIVAGIIRYFTPVFLQRLHPQPGEQVLDIACGTGIVARSVVPMVKPDGSVTGLDMNPAMLEVACQQFSDNCEGIEWHAGQAERLPFPDHAFDLVICHHGLQFFKDRSAAVHEMHRVLRPNGRVGIAVWQGLEKNTFVHAMFTATAAAFNIPIAGIAIPFQFGDRQELTDLLNDADFSHVRVEEICKNGYFPDPNRFVELSLRGASAAVPSLARINFDQEEKRFAEINHELSNLIQQYTVDGVLTIPWYANFAEAVR